MVSGFFSAISASSAISFAGTVTPTIPRLAQLPAKISAKLSAMIASIPKRFKA